MLFDTDVLVWLFRGNSKALRVVDIDINRRISIITYMELLQGARNKQEIKNIKSLLTEFNFEVSPLSENIGHRASIYMEEYGLKTAICLADAIIAATAVEDGVVLCTGNLKHFRLIQDLTIKPFRP